MKSITSIVVAFALIISLLLCGCRYGIPAESTSATAPQDTPPFTVSDAELRYSVLLEDYESIVSFRLSQNFERDWNNGSPPAISIALTLAIQENPHAEWSNMVVCMIDGLDHPVQSSFGYVLRDLNNDAFPEMIWVREDYVILAIFTIRGDRLVLLDAFWNKHECVVLAENKLYIRTSGGAAYTEYAILALDSQEEFLRIKQFGVDGYSAEFESLYYEIVDNQRNAISSDRFHELLLENPFEFGSEWTSQKIIRLGTE